MNKKMSLTILNVGGCESKSPQEVKYEEPISQIFFAHLTSCSKEEIQNATRKAGVSTISKEVRGGQKADFVSVEDIPAVLKSLKEIAGKEWLQGVDLDADTLELSIPSGSKIKISRE